MNEVELLVLDDDPKMVEGLSEILEGEGYVVTPFESPDSALVVLKRQRFSIALVDLIMPGKNGIDVLKEINKHCPNTKVIIITGFATIESAVEAMKAGATDYISKPFKINEIQNVIKKVLEEIRFEKDISRISRTSGSDRVLKAISNPIRRSVILLLDSRKKMRFTDIKNVLEEDDPTKLSFHLRELKGSGLISQDQKKAYSLSNAGRKTARLIVDLEKDSY
jgi:DNA-binding NtrC family response regulator